MKYICDTNFILRYLLADNPEMFAKAQEVFNRVKSGKTQLIIEQTVFTEVIFVLSSFYKVPKDKIAHTLSDLLAYKGIVSDKETLSLALYYYSKHNLHVVDCILMAKSKLTKYDIFTFDQQLLNTTRKKK